MRLLTTFCLVFLSGLCCFAQWQVLDTGIDGDLNGVVFFQQNGLLSTENGLYYTSNGGNGGASWTELHIPGNPSSSVFEDTLFSHCYAVANVAGSSGTVYACGKTNSEGRAVLFSIQLPSLECALLFHGQPGSSLNKLSVFSTGDVVAVGDHGQVITYSENAISEYTSITQEDLISVGYNTFANIVFGSSNKIWRATPNSFSNLLQSVIMQEIPSACEDAYGFFNNSAYFAGGDKAGYSSFSSAPVFYTNYFGPIDFNCIINRSANMFVGTDQGIFRSGGTVATGYLERQVTSPEAKINEFWLGGDAVMYAVGDNGLLIKTTGDGGATKPYVRLNLPNFCLGISGPISAYNGSGNSAKWFIDGQQVSTNLSGFNYTFTTPGQHLIEVEVKNSYDQVTTVSQYISVATIPLIDKPVSLSDQLLCKDQTIDIQISDSEPNVRYYLKRLNEPSSNLGFSQPGNGGIITFTTNPILLSGEYYIEAVSTIANCSKRFTANIPIVVEHTQADFHANLINATLGDPVKFFNNSQESETFEWSVTSASGNQVFTVENPVYVTSVQGETSVTLDAWSENGCHDQVVKNGPFVVEETDGIDCLAMVNYGTDLPWSGYYNEDIYDAKPVGDGFMTCGSFNDVIFDSAHGVTSSIAGKKGGYLTRYDDNGTLKWKVYVEKTGPGANENSDLIQACVEDHEGFIYIAGSSEGIFYDNTGNVVDLRPVIPGSGMLLVNHFLIKLTAEGELVWNLQSRFLQMNNILVDSQNNLIVQTSVSTSNGFQNIQVYLNSVPTQVVGNTVSATNTLNGLMKVTPSGTILWDTEIRNPYFSGSHKINHLRLDSSDNIYLAESNPTGLTFHSANGSPPIHLPAGGFDLVKYGTNGNVSWVNRVDMIYDDSTPPWGLYCGGMSVSDDGNVYLTGRNGCDEAGLSTFYFLNADGSTIETIKGTFYVAKVNANGICEWINSTDEYTVATGMDSFIEGNEWYVRGQLAPGVGNAAVILSGEFESSDGNNFTLVQRIYNYFLSVYDLNGNLLRVILNSEEENGYSYKLPRGFFKKGDNFYLMRNFDEGDEYHDFSTVFPALTEYEGTILKFKEECGVLKYDAALSTPSIDHLSKIVAYPNPTDGSFTILFPEVREKISVKVFDVLGNQVSSAEFESSAEIPMTLYAKAGVYFVRIDTSEDMQWLRIVKS